MKPRTIILYYFPALVFLSTHPIACYGQSLKLTFKNFGIFQYCALKNRKVIAEFILMFFTQISCSKILVTNYLRDIPLFICSYCFLLLNIVTSVDLLLLIIHTAWFAVFNFGRNLNYINLSSVVKFVTHRIFHFIFINI